jgi:hypothetical protein
MSIECLIAPNRARIANQAGHNVVAGPIGFAVVESTVVSVRVAPSAGAAISIKARAACFICCFPSDACLARSADHEAF